ncbi:ankyrin repeat domain-containing protein [Verrucomicrobia bacterium]|nr:ankyrin repeat domain-containing protein [Verrucomicrobiota bacterium]
MKHLLITTIAAVVLLGCGPSASERALIDAVYAGNVEAVKQHLDAGTDVNAKVKNGSTPLHFAAGYGRNEIVELLIAAGADVNAKNNRGGTPLGHASKHPGNADLLRKHGGKTGDWLNADKSIHKAASAGNIEAVKQHLAAGADVNAKTDDGGTPLGHAERHPEIADLLRKHGGKTAEDLKAEGK